MSRHLLFALASATLAIAPAMAQRVPDINGPKRAAQRAVAAENAQLSAQTGQSVPTKSAPVIQAGTPISGPGSTVVGKAPAPAAVANKNAMTRELFGYDREGRRDPFYSLILTDDLRPLLSDLKLVGVLYEAGGRRSVAIFRDIQNNTQYRVQPGMALGRMRVVQIKPKGVIFTIDEFGLSRQDSLMMTDTTMVRIR